MKTPIFTGSSVAIVTPLTERGINFQELDRLIEFQLKNGTDSITICGTTGESSTLTDEEHRQIIRHCIETVAGRVPVIAGTGSNDTAYALDLSLDAIEAGADGLLIVTPYYNKTTQHGLIKHYTYLADRISKPIIIYNVPSRTGMSCKAETYYELSGHPMINGVKEASGDFTLIAKTASLCGDNLFLWSGNDDQTLPILALGGKGVISVFANIMPRQMHDLVAAYLNGDVDTSRRLQLQYFDLMDKLFVEVNPIPVKTALALMGYDTAALRMPLCEMDPKNLEILKASMKNAGL